MSIVAQVVRGLELVSQSSMGRGRAGKRSSWQLPGSQVESAACQSCGGEFTRVARGRTISYQGQSTSYALRYKYRILDSNESFDVREIFSNVEEVLGRHVYVVRARGVCQPEYHYSPRPRPRWRSYASGERPNRFVGIRVANVRLHTVEDMERG